MLLLVTFCERKYHDQVSYSTTKMPRGLNVFFLLSFSYVFIFQTRAQLSFDQLDSRSIQLQLNERHYYRFALGANAIGPESIAFDCEGGGPYVGVSDGRILKWEGKLTGWTVFAITNPFRSSICDGIYSSPMEHFCGRPLGLKFNMATCELYIADSSFGLMKVSRYGGSATLLANSAEGIRFRFLNAIDIHSDTNDVYFTDSSSHYPRWEYRSITASDRSGRLMRYRPSTGVVSVLLRGLSFANGVALSKNKDFLLVAETVLCRVQRYCLTGPKVGTSELFIQLTGRPDNIHCNANGDFWIAQNPTKPIKVGESKMILESLDTNEIADASDVIEFGSSLWIGSVVQPYVINSC